MDIKAPNELLHQKITGQSIKNPKEMFEYLNEIHFPIWIRYVLVPGFTDSVDTLKETKEFIDSLSNVEKVEVLPYHPFAIPKYDELKIPYPLRDVLAPDKEKIKYTEEMLGIVK